MKHLNLILLMFIFVRSANASECVTRVSCDYSIGSYVNEIKLDLTTEQKNIVSCDRKDTSYGKTFSITSGKDPKIKFPIHVGLTSIGLAIYTEVNGVVVRSGTETPEMGAELSTFVKPLQPTKGNYDFPFVKSKETDLFISCKQVE